MNHLAEKKSIYPEIPKMFGGEFPARNGFNIPGWYFTEAEMNETLPDGSYPLLTMDISIPSDKYAQSVNQALEGFSDYERREVLTERAVTRYECDMACSHCFECNTVTENPLMTVEEIFQMLDEAKNLGLKSVKFLGPGELIHNRRLFEILDFLYQKNITISIFTKGLALGSDGFARKYFGVSAKELCTRIAAYPNVNIILGFTSADEYTENARIDSKNVRNYSGIRNQALVNLHEAGLNADPERQRLVLSCTPVMEDNIDEVFNIYKWAFERNIPTIVAPTMISGSGSLMPELHDQEFIRGKLVDLYTEIYHWLIVSGVLNFGDIERDGVSPYAGIPCNQFTCGLFVRKDGRVQACPGNENEEFVYEKDVRKKPLKEIWRNSLGYKLREQLVKKGKLTFTHPCYAKSEGVETPDGILVKNGSFPGDFYDIVRARIEDELEADEAFASCSTE